MTELRSAPANLRRVQGGPPPLVPALAYGALMIAPVAVSGIQPTSWPDSGVSEREGTAISGNLPRRFHPAGG